MSEPHQLEELLSVRSLAELLVHLTFWTSRQLFGSNREMGFGRWLRSAFLGRPTSYPSGLSGAWQTHAFT